MIGFLQGVLHETIEFADQPNDLKWIVLANGVGYLVSVPGAKSYREISRGSETSLYVHTHVREDSLELFGFIDRDEKEAFMSLTSVSGIGPRVAMGALSVARTGDLYAAITGGDQKFLNGLPGIGKKTAERILLELRDKWEKRFGHFGGEVQGELGPPQGARSALPNSEAIEDAKMALLGLGYREMEIQKALKMLTEKFDLSQATTEQVVRQGLQFLNKRGNLR